MTRLCKLCAARTAGRERAITAVTSGRYLVRITQATGPTPQISRKGSTFCSVCTESGPVQLPSHIPGCTLRVLFLMVQPDLGLASVPVLDQVQVGNTACTLPSLAMLLYCEASAHQVIVSFSCHGVVKHSSAVAATRSRSYT